MEHDLAELVDGDLADDFLGLIFMAAHPILSPDARSALTLKLVCGLATEDIAACHARAIAAEDTDWVRIAALYDGLAQISPPPWSS